MFIRPFLYKGSIIWIPSQSGGYNFDLKPLNVFNHPDPRVTGSRARPVVRLNR